jgi:hypothetical protein
MVVEASQTQTKKKQKTGQNKMSRAFIPYDR